MRFVSFRDHFSSVDGSPAWKAWKNIIIFFTKAEAAISDHFHREKIKIARHASPSLRLHKNLEYITHTHTYTYTYTYVQCEEESFEKGGLENQPMRAALGILTLSLPISLSLTQIRLTEFVNITVTEKRLHSQRVCESMHGCECVCVCVQVSVTWRCVSVHVREEERERESSVFWSSDRLPALYKLLLARYIVFPDTSHRSRRNKRRNFFGVRIMLHFVACSPHCSLL